MPKSPKDNLEALKQRLRVREGGALAAHAAALAEETLLLEQIRRRAAELKKAK